MKIKFCSKILIFKIKAYKSSPCHIELFMSEKESVVPKPADLEEPQTKKKESKKKLKRQKMMDRGE